MSFQNCMTFFFKRNTIFLTFLRDHYFTVMFIKIIFLSLFDILLFIQIDVIYYNDVKLHTNCPNCAVIQAQKNL